MRTKRTKLNSDEIYPLYGIHVLQLAKSLLETLNSRKKSTPTLNHWLFLLLTGKRILLLLLLLTKPDVPLREDLIFLACMYHVFDLLIIRYSFFLPLSHN